MQTKSDKDSSSSLSSDSKFNESSKKLRIYYNSENYTDIVLYQFNFSDTYYIKEINGYKAIKEVQSDSFFKFVDKFAHNDYFDFLQEKSYLNFGLDYLDRSFPDVVIPSFDRDSYQDYSARLDISNTSLLENSTFNIRKHSGDVLMDTSASDFSIKKEKNSSMDDCLEILPTQNFGKKEQFNVIQDTKVDEKRERKKANKRKRKQEKKLELTKNQKSQEKEFEIQSEPIDLPKNQDPKEPEIKTLNKQDDTIKNQTPKKLQTPLKENQKVQEQISERNQGFDDLKNIPILENGHQDASPYPSTIVENKADTVVIKKENSNETDNNKEKIGIQKKDPNILNVNYEKWCLRTDFVKWLLYKEMEYKNSIVKIVEKVDEKINILNKGGILDDFAEKVYDNLDVFYCQRNSMGKLQGLGKYLYKDKAFRYCRVGYFIEGKLSGIGIQLPIDSYNTKTNPENTIRWYKVGIWENNDLVKGFQWAFNFAKKSSTFTIGEMKKEKKHGDAVHICFSHNKDRYDFSKSLYEIIKEFKINYVCCGHFVDNLLCGKGKIINFKEKYMYAGIFKNTIYEGYGSLVYDDERLTYHGMFTNNKYNGFGKLCVNDVAFTNTHYKSLQTSENSLKKLTYCGNFQNELFHGIGEQQLIYNNGHIEIYQGNFESHFYHGEGQKFIGSLGLYAGHFKNNLFHGKGTYRELFGPHYVGSWKEGKTHYYGQFFMHVNIEIMNFIKEIITFE